MLPTLVGGSETSDAGSTASGKPGIEWDGVVGDVRCLAFGVGPLKDTLIVGAHDQSLYLYDTAGLCTREPGHKVK